jgi:DNA-directed RNA polymerase subunit beta
VRGTRPTYDLVDASTGEVILKAGDKATPRMVKKWMDEGQITELLVPFDHIIGRYVAKDIINEETGEIWVEAGDELTMEYDRDGEVKGGTVKLLLDQGITDFRFSTSTTSMSAPTSATPWRWTRTWAATPRSWTSTA